LGNNDRLIIWGVAYINGWEFQGASRVYFIVLESQSFGTPRKIDFRLDSKNQRDTCSPLTDLSLANEKMTRVDSVTLDERGEGTSQQQRQVRNILYVETIGNDGMEGRLNS